MSGNDTNDLRELAESLFSDARNDSADVFDAGLWERCERTGLARLTLPEKAGGSAGSFAEAAVMLMAAGRFAARLPLAETDLLAGWLLHAAGLDVPSGPLSATLAPDLRIDGATASGRLRRVAWGRSVAGVVALSGDRVALISPGDTEVVEGANVAEEPRDDLVLDAAAVRAGVLPPELMHKVAAEYSLRAALGRASLMAGAAHGALALSVRYATERVQFGRPIGRLQAVQQSLALAAAEVAAAATAAQAAALEVDSAGFVQASLAVAAAKARCGEAAGQVARIAHQVHGAIGFTREHGLRTVTTRLWAWREEDGTEAQWNDRLGGRALSAGPDGFWPLLTENTTKYDV